MLLYVADRRKSLTSRHVSGFQQADIFASDGECRTTYGWKGSGRAPLFTHASPNVEGSLDSMNRKGRCPKLSQPVSGNKKDGELAKARPVNGTDIIEFWRKGNGITLSSVSMAHSDCGAVSTGS
jgi:hypothetical protein